MTITIDISEKTEQRLREQAQRSGQDFDTFVRTLLDNSGKSLAETAAPIHEAFRRSGMSQEELDELTDELIREVREEKRLRVR